MLVSKYDASLWYDYYTSNVEKFHYKRFIRNNGKDVEENYRSLNIAKMITKELATYILAEAQYPDEINLSFNKLLTLIENTLAIGQIMLIKIDNDIKIFVPTQYEWYKENKEVLITESDTKQYMLDVINNQWYDFSTGKKQLLNNNVEFKFFSLSDDLQYPYGKSIYADCLDILKSVDMRYTNFYDEFVLGRPMVVATSEALSVEMIPSTDPKQPPTFKQYLHEDDKVFKIIAGNSLSTGDYTPPITQIKFELRTSQFIEAINLDLSLISKHAGFDNSFMAFDDNGIKTATEVIAKKSQLYKNIKIYQFKIKLLLEWLCQAYNVEYQDKIIFGDSVIVSDEQLKKDGQDLYLQKAIDKFTLLTKYYGYTAEKANEVLDLVQKEREKELEEEQLLLTTSLEVDSVE